MDTTLTTVTLPKDLIPYLLDILQREREAVTGHTRQEYKTRHELDLLLAEFDTPGVVDWDN